MPGNSTDSSVENIVKIHMLTEEFSIKNWNLVYFSLIFFLCLGIMVLAQWDWQGTLYPGD